MKQPRSVRNTKMNSQFLDDTDDNAVMESADLHAVNINDNDTNDPLNLGEIIIQEEDDNDSSSPDYVDDETIREEAMKELAAIRKKWADETVKWMAEFDGIRTRALEFALRFQENRSRCYTCVRRKWTCSRHDPIASELIHCLDEMVKEILGDQGDLVETESESEKEESPGNKNNDTIEVDETDA